jgi:hypothetical protein
MVHLANPRPLSFGVGVITARWLYVLMATTREAWTGQLTFEETLSVLDLDARDSCDIEDIRIQIRDSLRHYECGVRSRSREALIGAKAVTGAGIKDEAKDFNAIGEGLVERLRAFREGGVSVFGSLIIGLACDEPWTCDFGLTNESAWAGPGSSTVSDADASPYQQRVSAKQLVPELQIPSARSDD